MPLQLGLNWGSHQPLSLPRGKVVESSNRKSRSGRSAARTVSAGIAALAVVLSALVATPALADTSESEYLVSVTGDATDFRSTIAAAGGTVEDVYDRLDVLAVTLPDVAAEALDRRRDMLLEPNLPITALAVPSYGIDRLDQRDLPLSGTYTAPAGTRGLGVDVYVVDTGIRADHGQFSGRVAAGYNAVEDGRTATDCNGHGTHVAGTIAGTTVGVAPEARLIPVRVLNCSGSTSTGFEVLDGLEWVVANHQAGAPAVLNMSIGGPVSHWFNDAVAAAVADGITVVAAAGNENSDACRTSPASAPDALTVAAASPTDARASYSNWGTCVDVFAPGGDYSKPIYSASTGSTTGLAGMIGTSMAAPHVAGVAARYLSQFPRATPAEVATALLGAATPARISDVGPGTPNLLIFADPAGFAPPAPPSAPTGLTAVPSGGNVLVTWDAVSSPDAPVTDYTVSMSGPPAAGGPLSRSAGTATRLLFPGVGSLPRSFTVRATNPGGTSAESAPSRVVAAAPLALSLGPVPILRGIPAVGETLTMSIGTWGPGSVTGTFQWRRSGAVIPGATGRTYTLSAADAGRSISVTVIASKPGYASAARRSAEVAIGRVLTATPRPTISGTAVVGRTLSAAAGAWAPAAVAIRYEWRRDGVAITGATASTYRVRSADAGRTITVTVTGSKSGYTAVSRTSSGKKAATR